jgi:hypothetical protein
MSNQTTFDIPELRKQLSSTGSMHATDAKGRRLFVVLSSQLSVEEKGLLLAYEGEGCFFFTLDRPLNTFRLVQGGFSFSVAEWLANLINDIVGMGVYHSSVHDHTKQLSGPTTGF